MFARFKHWFVNVFWYHYRWHTIGFIAAALMIGSLIYSFAVSKERDVPYMMLSAGMREAAVTASLDEFLSETFGDVNGDGTVFNKGDYIDLNMSDTADPQVVMASQTRLYGTLMGRECALLIYTEGVLDLYEEDDMIVYLDLAKQGIAAAGDHPGRADVTGHPAIEGAGFGDVRVYAGVVAYDDTGTGALSGQQILALDVIRALVEGIS